MIDNRLDKILEFIYKMAYNENDTALIAMMNQFYSITSDPNSLETKALKKILTESQRKILESFTDYYQGLIFLGFAYFEAKDYEKTSEFEKKALQILTQQQQENSDWAIIAKEILNGASYYVGRSKITTRIEEKIKNIMKLSGEAAGFTLMCPKCGFYNPPKSKFCMSCAYKFTKKELKEQK